MSSIPPLGPKFQESIHYSRKQKETVNFVSKYHHLSKNAQHEGRKYVHYNPSNGSLSVNKNPEGRWNYQELASDVSHFIDEHQEVLTADQLEDLKSSLNTLQKHCFSDEKENHDQLKAKVESTISQIRSQRTQTSASPLSQDQIVDEMFLTLKSQTPIVEMLPQHLVAQRFPDITCPRETAIPIKGFLHRYLHANKVQLTKPELQGLTTEELKQKSFLSPYIVTQAPIEGLETEEMFWSAAFEHSNVIIDLTRPADRVRKYFPKNVFDGNTPKGQRNYNSISVTCHKVEKKAFDIEVHHYHVVDKKTNKAKDITRIHYPEWEDYGGIKEEDLIVLEYIKNLENKLSEQYSEPAPAMVHCRAGVGRSGTYVVASALIALQKDHSLSKDQMLQIIGNLVLEGRGQRGPHFVQSQDQLRTLVNLGNKLIEKGPERSFDDHERWAINENLLFTHSFEKDAVPDPGNTPGAFLLRDSTWGDNFFCLTFNNEAGTKENILFELGDDGTFQQKGRKDPMTFQTFDELFSKFGLERINQLTPLSEEESPTIRQTGNSFTQPKVDLEPHIQKKRLTDAEMTTNNKAYLLEHSFDPDKLPDIGNTPGAFFIRKEIVDTPIGPLYAESGTIIFNTDDGQRHESYTYCVPDGTVYVEGLNKESVTAESYEMAFSKLGLNIGNLIIPPQ